ncbi:MAG: nucleoside deaminase [Chlamydiales bacterium]|nr:nucleoside deaminase [Chlamydiales bacterium]
MKYALQLAKNAYALGEVPIGAVIVYKGRVIAEAHNETEKMGDPTAHAELLCIQRAAKALGNWRLIGCTLYCTLEPCAMCAGAILEARLDKVVWGAPDLRCGAGGSWVDLFDGSFAIHKVAVERGLCQEESAHLMRQFFKERRDARGNDCIARKKAAQSSL